MGWKGTIVRAANRALCTWGWRLERIPSDVKPWDAGFAKWIEDAKRSGKDPNDIGDQAWNDHPFQELLEKHVMPYINPESIVLELGPGTGRMTRRVIARCREMILLDNSTLVCEWLQEYLKGKGKARIHHIDKPQMPMVEDASVDVAFANGVFNFLDMEDLVWYLEELFRVLKPGGVVAFNFENIMVDEGLQHFRQWRERPGHRALFRYYHPDAVQRLAESVGFTTLRVTTRPSRFAYIEIRK